MSSWPISPHTLHYYPYHTLLYIIHYIKLDKIPALIELKAIAVRPAGLLSAHKIGVILANLHTFLVPLIRVSTTLQCMMGTEMHDGYYSFVFSVLGGDIFYSI